MHLSYMRQWTNAEFHVPPCQPGEPMTICSSFNILPSYKLFLILEEIGLAVTSHTLVSLPFQRLSGR